MDMIFFFLNPFLTVRLFRVARQVTNHIAFYLPRNSNIDQVSTDLCNNYLASMCKVTSKGKFEVIRQIFFY